MAVDYSNRALRPDFKAERDRLLSAIRDCEKMDAELTNTCDDLRAGMSRTRGSASLVIRLTEQIISNRGLRLSLVKELRSLKRDVVEREIRLAEKASGEEAKVGASAVTAELLRGLQAMLLGRQRGASLMLEPVDSPLAPVDPAPLAVGDIVADAGGSLWLISEDGAEPLEAACAASIDMSPEDGSPPYAVLDDGRVVPVVDIGT